MIYLRNKQKLSVIPVTIGNRKSCIYVKLLTYYNDLATFFKNGS